MQSSIEMLRMPAPLVVVDVQYQGDTGATAACVVAQSWTDDHATEERVTRISTVRPYKPGSFFERELPCILEVLRLVRHECRVIVIDGYVELDDKGTPGLGGHLFDHFQGAMPVIGVAKTAFRGAAFAGQVLRGTSDRPLFVTARGIELDRAVHWVKSMHGEHRIPTLIKRVDRLARELDKPKEMPGLD